MSGFKRSNMKQPKQGIENLTLNEVKQREKLRWRETGEHAHQIFIHHGGNTTLAHNERELMNPKWRTIK